MEHVQEIKTDIDVAQLPKFTFQTDQPMRSLFISNELLSDVQEKDGRIIEIRKEDGRSGDGKKRVRLIASSDATDLVGDVMSKNALNQMKSAAVGTTIFLNHDPTI